jgi:hypothetical protein
MSNFGSCAFTNVDKDEICPGDVIIIHGSMSMGRFKLHTIISNTTYKAFLNPPAA